MSNPFADYGTVVSGHRFVGRQDELRLISGRVFGEAGYGSLAVTGLPRIGKTSLVAEAVRANKERFESLRAVVVREDIGAFSSTEELFRSLISNLIDEIRTQELSTEKLELRAVQALESVPLTFERIRSVFRQMREASIRAVCILDEFDAGRYLFSNSPQFFHWLRELCSNPEFKAAFVFLSKRPLPHVARLAGHSSDYWANVLMTLTLRPFTAEDLATFQARLKGTGVEVGPDIVEEVAAMCGRHPYLLDAFAFHAWERASRSEQVNSSWFHSTIREIARGYFEQVATVLRDGPMLGNLIQVVAGPQWNLAPSDVDALVDYGVLSLNDGSHLHAFSAAFEDYLRFIEHSVEIWPLWRETERALRSGLESLLTETFGSSWPVELKKARPKLGRVIEDCEHKMRKEHERFGQRAASTILAYTYPLDLFNIMAADWPSLGEPLLGRDKQGWAVKFTVLSKVRTPLAHNRDEAVEEGERLQAEGICREILQRYKLWNEQ
jgi:hypothetical protein